MRLDSLSPTRVPTRQTVADEDDAFGLPGVRRRSPKSSRTEQHQRALARIVDATMVDSGDWWLNRMKAWQGSLGMSTHRGIADG